MVGCAPIPRARRSRKYQARCHTQLTKTQNILKRSMKPVIGHKKYTKGKNLRLFERSNDNVITDILLIYCSAQNFNKIVKLSNGFRKLFFLLLLFLQHFG